MGKEKKIMPQICKNLCSNGEYEHKKLVRGDLKREYKRCSKCCIFLKYEGVFCPCCGVRLKYSPRNNCARKRYYERKKSIK